jgi:hypothetical protein
MYKTNRVTNLERILKMNNKHSMAILIEQLQRMNAYQKPNEKLNIQVKNGLIKNLQSSSLIDDLKDK